MGRPLALTACVLLAGVLTACGADDEAPPGPAASPSPSSSPSSSQSSEPSDAGSSAPDEEIVITIADFAYEVPESVPAGATVTVVNNDDVAHTVTAEGDFDVNVAPGETGMFTAPDAAGEYEFICIFHSNMTGTLVVA